MSNRKRPRGRPSKYPPEFQRDAVAMVLDEGRAIAEVGRAIGVIDIDGPPQTRCRVRRRP